MGWAQTLYIKKESKEGNRERRRSCLPCLRERKRETGAERTRQPENKRNGGIEGKELCDNPISEKP